MRRPAVVFPALLVLAGAGYYLTPARNIRDRSVTEGRQYESTAPIHPAGETADMRDAALVRDAIERKNLTELEISNVIGAAGRRYVRRRTAYNEARQQVAGGRLAEASLEPLKQEMDMARMVVDLAESLGRPSRTRADLELERRLAYSPRGSGGLVDRFNGSSEFKEEDLSKLEQAFQSRFGHPLIVSARGASALHRIMGFDHRGRFDVAVSPEQPEGVWVRSYLTAKNVTFLAFGSAVPGQATGAHIHIGRPSGHYTAD